MEDFMASKNQNGKMPNEHLHELFVDELRDIMGAERQLLKGLKKMTNATKSESLKTAFETHYAETEEHINRRSEEHKSELQSLMRHSYAVVCLKKQKTNSQ